MHRCFLIFKAKTKVERKNDSHSLKPFYLLGKNKKVRKLFPCIDAVLPLKAKTKIEEDFPHALVPFYLLR